MNGIIPPLLSPRVVDAYVTKKKVHLGHPRSIVRNVGDDTQEPQMLGNAYVTKKSRSSKVKLKKCREPSRDLQDTHLGLRGVST